MRKRKSRCDVRRRRGKGGRWSAGGLEHVAREEQVSLRRMERRRKNGRRNGSGGRRRGKKERGRKGREKTV